MSRAPHERTGAASRLRLARALERARLEPGLPHPCPYLPGRTARTIVLLPRGFECGLYHGLMDLNFRRSGPLFYRPACEGCRECRAIRVPVATFRPTRSQRRCWARNRDLSASVGRPAPSPEKYELYRRYLNARHDDQMDRSWEEFGSFLHASPIATLEVSYRLGDRLLAVGILDEEPEAVSTVYCYFAPGERSRGLGVYNVLWTLERARARGVPHVYLGYLVAGSPRMEYKAGFGPHELLDAAGTWRPGRA